MLIDLYSGACIDKVTRTYGGIPCNKDMFIRALPNLDIYDINDYMQSMTRNNAKNRYSYLCGIIAKTRAAG